MIHKLVLFIFPLLLLACVKDQQTDPATLYTSPEFYIKFNMVTDIELRQTVGDFIADAYSEYRGDEYVESSVFSKKGSQFNEGFSISLSKIFYSNPSQLQTDSLFTIGMYRNFLVSTPTNVSVRMKYIDSNGMEWSTDLGSGQTGSYFQIINSEPSAGPGFRYKIRGRFSCTLYNQAFSFHQVTGEFTCKFGEGNF